jgi:hypothetical protein
MFKREVYVCVLQRMLVEGGAAGRSEIDRETRYCWWVGGGGQCGIMAEISAS